VLQYFIFSLHYSHVSSRTQNNVFRRIRIEHERRYLSPTVQVVIAFQHNHSPITIPVAAPLVGAHYRVSPPSSDYNPRRGAPCGRPLSRFTTIVRLQSPSRRPLWAPIIAFHHHRPITIPVAAPLVGAHYRVSPPSSDYNPRRGAPCGRPLSRFTTIVRLQSPSRRPSFRFTSPIVRLQSPSRRPLWAPIIVFHHHRPITIPVAAPLVGAHYRVSPPSSDYNPRRGARHSVSPPPSSDYNPRRGAPCGRPLSCFTTIVRLQSPSRRPLWAPIIAFHPHRPITIPVAAPVVGAHYRVSPPSSDYNPRRGAPCGRPLSRFNTTTVRRSDGNAARHTRATQASPLHFGHQRNGRKHPPIRVNPN
jgi:hypothetical protein